jgi:hypothetical protein
MKINNKLQLIITLHLLFSCMIFFQPSESTALKKTRIAKLRLIIIIIVFEK